MAFLDELLTGGEPAGTTSVELPEGLMPQVVLDSSWLQALLARGDARQDRAMAGLVRHADDLQSADGLALLSSVYGWQPARIVEQ